MAKIKIRIDPETGMVYLPKLIRREGFTGEVELLSNALTVTLIKPGANLADIERSLGIILQDVALRRQQEDNMKKTKRPKQETKLPTQRHPIFEKYTRAWLSEVTGYSLGYLSRIATGRISLSNPFMERVCYKIGKSADELFLLEAGDQESPRPTLSTAVK